MSRRVLRVPYLRWRVVGKTLLHHRLPMCSTRVCDPQQFKVTDVPIKYHRGFQKGLGDNTLPRNVDDLRLGVAAATASLPPTQPRRRPLHSRMTKAEAATLAAGAVRYGFSDDGPHHDAGCDGDGGGGGGGGGAAVDDPPHPPHPPAAAPGTVPEVGSGGSGGFDSSTAVRQAVSQWAQMVGARQTDKRRADTVQEVVRDDHEAWMACMVARGEKMQIIMQAHAAALDELTALANVVSRVAVDKQFGSEWVGVLAQAGRWQTTATDVDVSNYTDIVAFTQKAMTRWLWHAGEGHDLDSQANELRRDWTAKLDGYRSRQMVESRRAEHHSKNC